MKIDISEKQVEKILDFLGKKIDPRLELNAGESTLYYVNYDVVYNIYMHSIWLKDIAGGDLVVFETYAKTYRGILEDLLNHAQFTDLFMYSKQQQLMTFMHKGMSLEEILLEMDLNVAMKSKKQD